MNISKFKLLIKNLNNIIEDFEKEKEMILRKKRKILKNGLKEKDEQEIKRIKEKIDKIK